MAHFRRWYGPTLRAFAALDARGGERLRGELVRLWSDHDEATDGTTRVRSE